MSRSFAILLFLVGVLSAVVSLADEPAKEEKTTPLNRLDFTAAFFNSVDLDKLTGLLGYTRNLSSNSNLNVRVAYLDSRFGLSGGMGIGDTTLTWSYLPKQRITVGPWFPRVVGSGIAVTLPTGNEDEGRGLGSTILTPFIGTVYSVTDTFSITPNLAYAYSIDPILTGTDVRVAQIELGFTVVRKDGWWGSGFFGYFYDFETDNTSFGTRLSAGKVFTNGWGLAAHYIDIEGFIPGVQPGADPAFNQLYELTVSYGF